MFRKEFVDVIKQTGMVPIKDLMPLLQNNDKMAISEFGLLKFDFFDDMKFAKQLANKYDLMFIDLSQAKVRNETLALMKRINIIKYRGIPIQKANQTITIAIYDPSIVEDKGEIQRVTQSAVEFVLTSLSSWEKIYNNVQESVEDLLETIQEVKIGSEEDEAREVQIKDEDIGEEVISYVNKILVDSFVKKASDIHIEPYEKRFRVRFRIDGKLLEIAEPPQSLILPIISRLKIMSKMDISEKRRPQDGRIKLLIGGLPIDYRVSSLPTLFGEKIVLRLLDSSNLQLDMTKLGFNNKQISSLKEGIHKPYGMCLVTGPTGSGKTTTLYSSLYELNKVSTNISTAEDPVEFNLEGINQVNIHKEAGLDFAAALKAFLRQDPDIIMVGEIRDQEVAEIAVEAALTGHLVLSTLHTNDAASTVTRLINMGIEPFLVSGALNIVVAQRLCRKICSGCKVKADISVDKIIACGLPEESAKKIKIYKGFGCNECNKTGYKGRVAIYEILTVTPNIKELLLQNPTADQLKQRAIKDGMLTLRMSALNKVAEGFITLEEAVINSAPDQ